MTQEELAGFWRLVDEYAQVIKAGGPPALIADAAAPLQAFVDWRACAKDALASIQNCCRMALHEGSDKTKMLQEIEYVAKRAWEDE